MTSTRGSPTHLTGRITGQAGEVLSQREIKTSARLVLDSVTVNWLFENIPNGLGFKVGTNPDKVISSGFLRFSELVTKYLKPEKIEAWLLPDLRCEITTTSDESITLGPHLSHLLGFNDSDNRYVVTKGATLLSDSPVRFNGGLSYALMFIDELDSTSTIGVTGQTSGPAFLIPLPSDGVPYGSSTHIRDINRVFRLADPCFNNLTIRITDQDGNPVNIGTVTLEFSLY